MRKHRLNKLAFGLTATLLLQACGGGETARSTPGKGAPAAAPNTNAGQHNSQPQPPAPSGAHDGHSHGPANRVPAHFASAKDVKSLPPVLPATRFFGKARLAYAAVKEIPQTIAQLPCYCYCDEGFGHKSLHSCFVDDHAAHCAVCVDEALLAYKWEKEERLTPEQIRERIVAQYGAQR